MIKINDDFDLDYTPGCWTLTEWRDGFKVKLDKRTPTRTSRQTYYSSLIHAVSSVIDRSAGNACAESRSIIDAVIQAKNDLHMAICRGGWKCRNTQPK